VPNRFLPLRSDTDMNQLLAVLNKNFGELDGETVTKVFLGANNRVAIIEGKLPYDGGYGALYYDANGVPRVLIGINPDGGVGLYVSKVDESVIDAFS
jgi:hypothetical protein